MRARYPALIASIVMLGGLTGCGQSKFAKQMTAICHETTSSGVQRDGLPGYDGRDCGCVVAHLDKGLPERLKAAFVPLRWPLMPAPQDRERVNGQLLRAAGIDPTDRQAVDSAQSELQDTLHDINQQINAECPRRQ